MPLYTEKEMQEAQSANALGALVLLVLALAFLNAPGMVLLGFARDSFNLALDTGQMWVFSIVASLAFLFGFRMTTKQWSDAGLIYLVTCVAVAVVMLLCSFGFKAEFPGRYLSYFLG